MCAEEQSLKLHLFGGQAPILANATAELVGNKAANLLRMAEAGLPVPAGFVLPTTLCRAYFQEGCRLPAVASQLLRQGIHAVESATGLSFGSDRRPLMISVRSGATVSMPGMLDTILNIGLCDQTLPSLIRMTGNPRHAWDCYRRLIQTYAEVVRGLPAEPFELILQEQMRCDDVPVVGELDVVALRKVTAAYLSHFKTVSGELFPQDPMAQLTGAVEAVFRSWESPRAIEYRRLYRLDNLAGTAVTVQAMVFGNLGGTSGSGVGFTRDPATGVNTLYLDFVVNAQGEDVVSGRCPVQNAGALQDTIPALTPQLRDIGRRLEFLFRDAQDFEFTIQEGQLFLLQTRHAKRTAWAALRIACDLVAEGLIDEATALERLADYQLDSIRTVRLAAADGCRPIGSGVSASPGVAVGEAVFQPEAAVALGSSGRSPILVRQDISTSDIAALAASAGVLTARGGRTSHAAVVARQLNKVCIVGCRELTILDNEKSCRIGDLILREGDSLSLDGNSGRIYAGQVALQVETPTTYLREVERWKANLQGPLPAATTATS